MCFAITLRFLEMTRPFISKVDFFSWGARSWIKDKHILGKFITSLFKREGRALEKLTIIFCSDQNLLKINRKYLRHNTYTDVITFDLSESPLKIIGEIYISLDRIKANAKTYKVSPTQELHRVIFHGVLHLCEYMDTPHKKRVKMQEKEDEYLSKYHLFVSREKGST